MIMDRVEINGVWYVREDLTPSKKPVNDQTFDHQRHELHRTLLQTA